MPIVNIIGGGISGLVCAIKLERHGIAPVIIEKEGHIGGRLKTSEIDNCFFDRGFQVLLTAYPAARRYLDFEKLDLQKFLPGAAILKDSKIYKIGDPLRNLSFLMPTMNFPSVNIRDGNSRDEISFKTKMEVYSKNLRISGKKY